MVDTTTTVLGLVKQTIGGNRNTWGGILNSNEDKTEASVVGQSAKALTGGSYTLTDAERRNRFLLFSGTLASEQTVEVANLSSFWIVRNATSGAHALKLKTPSGTAVTIPQSTWTLAWCDANDVINVLTVIPSLASLIQTFLAATTAAAARLAIGAADSAYALIPGDICIWPGITVRTGCLEANGATYSRSTYANLFAAYTTAQTGTRASAANGIISGLSDTTHLKVGFFAEGTGIAAGRTIASVDSATQVTLSGNNTGTGTATVTFSPYAFGDGSTTATLPDLVTDGRFIRSRTSTVAVGALQADQNLAHGHTASASTSGSVAGTTGNDAQDHTHSGTTGNDNQHHSHEGGDLFDNRTQVQVQSGTGAVVVQEVNSAGNANTGGIITNHNHSFTSGGVNSNHTHTFSASISASTSVTVNSSGGSEARPKNISFIVCIKT